MTLKNNFDPKKPGDGYQQLIRKKAPFFKTSLTEYPETNPNSPFGKYYYPTLWGYYTLLPVQLRNHPFIMTVLQGLEKYHYKVQA